MEFGTQPPHVDGKQKGMPNQYIPCTGVCVERNVREGCSELEAFLPSLLVRVHKARLHSKPEGGNIFAYSCVSVRDKKASF